MDTLEDPLAAAAARRKEKRRRKKQHRLYTQALLDDVEHSDSISDAEQYSNEETELGYSDKKEITNGADAAWKPPPIPLQIARLVDILAEENDEDGTTVLTKRRQAITVSEVKQFGMLSSRFAKIEGSHFSTAQPLGAAFADAVTQTVCDDCLQAHAYRRTALPFTDVQITCSVHLQETPQCPFVCKGQRHRSDQFE